MMRKTWKAVAAAAVLAVGLAGCSNPGEQAESSSAAPGEGTLRIAQAAAPDSLVPWQISSTASINIAQQVYHSLVDMTPAGEFTPYLATDWSQSTDGLSWTFNLRDDVYWQTGNDLFGDEKVPVTAQDVKFSYDFILDPANQARHYDNLVKLIDSVEVVDDHTVTFNLKKVGSLLLFRLSKVRIFPERGIKKNWDFKAYPVGSAAYKFKEHVKDDHLTLERNEDYWLKPGVKEVEFRFIADQSVAAIALQNGEVDVALNVNPTDAAQITEANGLELVSAGLGNPNLFTFNFDDPLLSDVKVRTALAQAVDADAIITAAYKNNAGIEVAKRGFSPLPPERAGYDAVATSAVTPQFDPQAAARSLEDLGWKKNEAGFYAKGGDTLAFEIKVSNSDANKEKVAVVTATQLQAFGVDAKVTTVENGTFIADSEAGDTQLSIFSGYDGPAASTQVMHTQDKHNPNNGYSNPDVDALLDEAWTVTLDERKRSDQIREATVKFASDVPYLFAYYVYSQVGVSERVEDFDEYPTLEFALSSSSRNVTVR
ncbi:ABC transporter substrate-binding protein [Paenarthrobacter sp. NPDC089675]|uniref:ABC transporter substrate-binding protein n=1 Tax=Paenarthrobacter sp. NPDC089675 TaxID=3364376 RepID=UPI0038308622